jgi:RHS repeat-associated protein
VVWSATYDAFGKAGVDASSTIINNLRFPGQYFDAETGLHYNWNRYYDSGTGRYVTEDPIGFNVRINLYLYLFSNPQNYIDPRGLGPYCGSGWSETFVSDAPNGYTHFGDCCRKHDECYDHKNPEDCGKDQKKCDDDLYKCLSDGCKNGPYPDWAPQIPQFAGGPPEPDHRHDKADCENWASTYHIGVNKRGGGAWNRSEPNRRNSPCAKK